MGMDGPSATVPWAGVITHNGGGAGGNADVAYYPDRRLAIIVLSNYITYRTIGPVPIAVSLPATELRQQLAANIATGDFTTWPRQTFSIYPYVATGVAGLIVLLALAWAWRIWIRRPKRIGTRGTPS